MERICEFCAALRPVVFCKADSAFLCLSCDAKVHSANALSNRHFRCLVCESCSQHPAHIRCLDHRMLLCRSCDASLHQNIAKLNQHRRRMVGSFTGSPSAKQFAILWGFDASQLALQEQPGGPTASSISGGSVVSTSFSAGSSYAHRNKMSGKDEQQQSSLIMQQILDLNRLQLNETNNPSSSSSVIRERGSAHSTSSCVYNNTLGAIDECVEDAMMRDTSAPIDEVVHALRENQFLPSPLSNSEYLSSYASAGGIEPFWQSRNALNSDQFWPQNMEEPRVCEELDGFDDLKMPEVDMTFPNFEELLRGDQDLSRALLEDDDSNAFFCSEKDPQSPHVTGNKTQLEEKHTPFPHQDYQALKSNESTSRMRPSYSYSYSFSHLSTAESSDSDCHDTGHSIGNPEDKKKHGMNKATRSC